MNDFPILQQSKYFKPGDRIALAQRIDTPTATVVSYATFRNNADPDVLSEFQYVSGLALETDATKSLCVVCVWLERANKYDWTFEGSCDLLESSKLANIAKGEVQ